MNLKEFLRENKLGVYGLGALIILIAFVGILQMRQSPPEIGAKQTIGQIGGFHLLTNYETEVSDNKIRLTVSTELNRTSPVPNIRVPRTSAVLLENNDSLVEEEQIDPQSFGSYRIQIDMADTEVASQEIRDSLRITEIDQDPVNSIRLTGASDQNLKILVGLDEPVPFSLKNPDEGGDIELVISRP